MKSWREHPWLGRSVEMGMSQNIWQAGQTLDNFIIKVTWNEYSPYYEKMQNLLWKQRVKKLKQEEEGEESRGNKTKMDYPKSYP